MDAAAGTSWRAHLTFLSFVLLFVCYFRFLVSSRPTGTLHSKERMGMQAFYKLPRAVQLQMQVLLLQTSLLVFRGAKDTVDGWEMCD